MTELLADALVDGLPFATFVWSVDFSSAVKVLGSAELAAMAIGSIFTAGAKRAPAYVQHDSLFAELSAETRELWQRLRVDQGLSAVRTGWASHPGPLTAEGAWSMLVAARLSDDWPAAVREYGAILADSRAGTMVALAAKTPPVVSRDRHSLTPQRAPGAEDAVVMLDFVGYTAAIRDANGVAAGRDLAGELQVAAVGVSGAREILAKIYPLRLAQQLELENLLARMDQAADGFDAVPVSTSLDGGPGSDGRLFLVASSAASALRETLVALAEGAGYACVAAIGPRQSSPAVALEPCMAWAKVVSSRGGANTVEAPCGGCLLREPPTTPYEARQRGYVERCSNLLPS